MAKQRECEIYGIYDPRTGCLCYIGKCTIGVATRFRIHVKQLKDGKHHNPRLQCLFNKLAREDAGSLSCKVLETCEADSLSDREIWWIADARTKGIDIFNVTDGGGSLGHTFSEERRRKISESKRGKKQEWSEEGKASFVAKHKLRRLTEAQKNAISQRMKGSEMAKRSAERLARYSSEVRKGSTLSESHKKAMREAKQRPGTKAVGNSIGVSKLVEAQVRALWADYKSGMGCRRLAKKYGIAISSTHSIVTRKTWKHLGLL